MANSLKSIYNRQFIDNLSKTIKKHHSSWKENLFIKKIFTSNWSELELKQRVGHITEVLYEMLPNHYPDSIAILKKVVKNRTGYENMFFPHFVERYGLSDWKTSIPALEYFTQFSSSEFAVRPFIIKNPVKMMKQMEKWSNSPNLHVRRLSSEGCRPRLPWAIRLAQFIEDPSPIWAILENLKKDENLYVKKSVANNLNDMAKDHPHAVLAFAQKNHGQSIHTDWIIKHGLRTLLKLGDIQALNIIGYQRSKCLTIKKFKWDKKVTVGNNLSFSFTLTSNESLGYLRIEYEIEFFRPSGKNHKKIFKIGEGEILVYSRIWNKRHSFKPISTRVHYPGWHKLSIIVNGESLATGEFELMS